MTSDYMRKLMEAVEDSASPFAQEKNKLMQQLDALEQGKTNAPDPKGAAKRIREHLIPKLDAIIENGYKNPNNIVINPWKAGSKKALGSEESWIISGSPEEVFSAIQDSQTNYAKAIRRDLDRIEQLAGENITWQELYIAYNLVDYLPDLTEWSWLAIGEGEDKIADLRLYKGFKDRYPTFIVNGQIIKSESKLEQYVGSI